MNIGFTPVNQVRLTNVAYVRLQKKGKRFEIACYRNKVLNWRNKIETDIGEVLQIDTVFTNVSKGMLASSKDLVDAFGTADQKLVCKEILDKGELQVSEQERGAQLESVFRDVASIVADKTVNPETNRPYTISMIQNAMKQIQYSVSVSKNSKSQALDVIRKLREIMPIVRANMLLRLVCAETELDGIRIDVAALGALVVGDSSASRPDAAAAASSSGHSGHLNCFVDIRVDPESFRRVEEIVAERTAGAGRVEVVQLRVANSATGSAATALGAHGADTDEEEEAPLDHAEHADGKKHGNALQKRELKNRQRGERIEALILLNSNAAQRPPSDADSGGDEEEALGMVVKASRKKGKAKKGAKVVPAAPAPDSGEDSQTSEDEGLQRALAGSLGHSAQGSETKTSVSGAAPRKGKKGRRAEKEELREREVKAAALRQRALLQQQHQLVEPPVAVVPSSSGDAAPPAAPPAAPAKTQSCNTCGGEFADPRDYRNHFKSEWHRHNLSRKMRSLPLAVSEEAFLALSLEELGL